jgi:hypothetical protein
MSEILETSHRLELFLRQLVVYEKHADLVRAEIASKSPQRLEHSAATTDLATPGMSPSPVLELSKRQSKPRAPSSPLCSVSPSKESSSLSEAEVSSLLGL